MVLLTNGKVLLVGGGEATSELYDPTTGDCTLIGSMASVHPSGPILTLANKNVMVSGGANGASFLATVDIYRPTTNDWVVGAPMNTGRTLHTATLLPNGHVAVAGGLTTGSVLTNSVEIFDGINWNPKANLLQARFTHFAFVSFLGDLVVGGGLVIGNVIDATVERYTIAQDKWISDVPLQVSRANTPPMVYANGDAIVIGGDCPVIVGNTCDVDREVEMYPKDSTSAPTTSMPTPPTTTPTTTPTATPTLKPTAALTKLPTAQPTRKPTGSNAPTGAVNAGSLNEIPFMLLIAAMLFLE
jgi:hypothetical protein